MQDPEFGDIMPGRPGGLTYGSYCTRESRLTSHRRYRSALCRFVSARVTPTASNSLAGWT